MSQEIEHWRSYDEWGVIRVVDQGPYRFLCFNDELMTEQSCMITHMPEWIEFDYVQAMLLSAALHASPRRALLFGLGGATLANALRRFFPSLEMDIVELRPDVLTIAERFFHFNADDPLTHVHITDALEYLGRPDLPQYDLILCDIYLEEGMATAQGTGPFVELCNRLLAPKGIIIYNQWQLGETGRPTNEALFAAHYPDRYWLLPVDEGNVAVVAFLDDVLDWPLPKEEIDRIKQLGRQHQITVGRLMSRLSPPKR
ncbi:spermidine synthase [Pokkaliibacter sp. CJK22405]|uniref:spermidine synthase n=1 Tax=Pokkaliibacter sp. CJK22405 TaxID=3384615 RepID=UPI003984E95F